MPLILLPSYLYNMHQDTKSARLIAVSKCTLRNLSVECYICISVTMFFVKQLSGLWNPSHYKITSHASGISGRLLVSFLTRFTNCIRFSRGRLMSNLPFPAWKMHVKFPPHKHSWLKIVASHSRNLIYFVFIFLVPNPGMMIPANSVGFYLYMAISIWNTCINV